MLNKKEKGNRSLRIKAQIQRRLIIKHEAIE